jgi:hypothetical protein
MMVWGKDPETLEKAFFLKHALATGMLWPASLFSNPNGSFRICPKVIFFEQTLLIVSDKSWLLGKMLFSITGF